MSNIETLHRISTPLWVWAGACVLLCGAWFIEYMLKVPPCELCLLQRWPYYIAIGGIPFLYMIRTPLKLQTQFALLVCVSSAGLGIYHTGVEQHWWLGLNTCGGGTLPYNSENLDAALDMIIPRCDSVYFTVLGLSLANWNVVFSGVGALALIKPLMKRSA